MKSSDERKLLQKNRRSFLLYVLKYGLPLFALRRSFEVVTDLSPLHSMDAPEGWIKWMLRTGDGREEAVVFSEKLNRWLFSAMEIGLRRDRASEKALRRQLRKKWRSIGFPLLRQNYSVSQRSCMPFHNEEKVGMTSALVPGSQTVRIRRTCYYDAFLSNIAAGKKLVRRDPSGPRFSEDAVHGLLPPTDEKNRLLEEGRGSFFADGIGVSTLLLQRGEICLWRQEPRSQSSPGLIVPTGSGSSDWSDCSRFSGDPDAFRKTLFYGMVRELREEAFHDVPAEDAFFEKTETRILGCFRWMRKAGKPEFVGITRWKDPKDAMDYSLNADELVPKAYVRLEAETVFQLRESIAGMISCSETEEGVCLAPGCSAPCAAALLFLDELCRQACRTCGRCGSGTCRSCGKRTESVCFSDDEQIFA